MTGVHYLGEDMARIRGTFRDRFTQQERPNRVVRILYWGDEVDLIDPTEASAPDVRDIRVRYYDYSRGETRDGTIRKRRRNGQNVPLKLLPGDAIRPLAVTFVDVQQGDAALIRTPSGRHILIDGGEEVFIARLLASEFPGTTAAEPLVLDAVVVTHGDADHFEGLAELADAASHPTPRKQIHARIARCFHNGLVKKPERVPDGSGGRRRLKDRERFGDPVAADGEHYIVDLVNDPRTAAEPNGPFERWGRALDQMLLLPAAAGGIRQAPAESLPVLSRLRAGDDNAFRTFAEEGLAVEVLGPIETVVAGQPALEVLRDPEGGQSASHTINGHSLVLRLVFGKVRLLLGGDLNVSGAERLLAHADGRGSASPLESEILKVPHHGSHEFSNDFLSAVAPVVSVVSSGDENASKEFVHPRANLLASLGRYGRGPEPLVFSTELAAFFAYRGGVQPERHRREDDGELEDLPASQRRGFFFAFERLRFGTIRVRTDGARVFVAPESASDRVKEAYAFRVEHDGTIVPDDVHIV